MNRPRPFTEASTFEEALAILDHHTHQNTGDDACWSWVGQRWRGHGRIKARDHSGCRVFLLAHRIAFERHLGRPLSCFEVVGHRCGNPSCVNPHHLGFDKDMPPQDGPEVAPPPLPQALRRRRPANMSTSDEQAAQAIALYFGPDGAGSPQRLGRRHLWIKAADLAKQFGVSVPHIKALLWGQKARSKVLTDEQVAEVRALFYGEKGIGSVSLPGTERARYRMVDIAKQLKISRRSLEKIRTGERFRHLPRPAHAPQPWPAGARDYQGPELPED